MHRSLLYAAAIVGFIAVEAAARDSLYEGLSTLERVRLASLQWFVGIYVFTFGAILGSFLNVVIYRLPRGMNIVRPRSRCPACRTPIAFWDNIPVLSWLLLRGKCRTCLSPISPRYPLVEGAVGGILLLLCWLEVALGGVNLPLKKAIPLNWLGWQVPWQDLILIIYHAWLLITLLVMGLIQWDRQRVPAVIVRLALAVSLLLPLAWPALRPVPALEHCGGWHGCIDGLLGVAAGLLVGNLLALLVRRSHRRRGGKASLIAATILIGAFLGWQSAVDIGLFCAVAMLVVPLIATVYPRALSVPPLIWLTLIAWLYVPLWKYVWLAGCWLQG